MPQPIFLIANDRSGTHLLRGFMRGGGQVEDYNEVFNPQAVGDRPQDYFRYLAVRVASDPDLAIPVTERRDRLFDDFIAHLAEHTAKPYMLIDVKYSTTHHFDGIWHHVDSPPRLISLIIERGYPVIHLVRRNTLEAYCSYRLASATRRWSRPRDSVGPPPADRTIKVDVGSLVRNLESMQTRANFFAWCLRDHAPTIQLYYEDLLEDSGISPRVHDAICGLVGARLDLPRTPAYAKVSPPLREYVRNYPDVIRALSGTRFLTMIS